jgi:tRNA threonylcarbamoyladenosine biosynthesis protein TsaE
LDWAIHAQQVEQDAAPDNVSSPPVENCARTAVLSTCIPRQGREPQLLWHYPKMIIATDADMRAFGQKLAQELQRSDWVAINGPLGAGKTVLCAGILAGLGFEGEVASPSYAIVHSYESPEVSIAVAHVDLYRLENADELDELGLADERTDRITLVEWAERFGPAYVVPSHTIDIWPQADGTRILTLKMDKNDTRN